MADHEHQSTPPQKVDVDKRKHQLPTLKLSSVVYGGASDIGELPVEVALIHRRGLSK